MARAVTCLWDLAFQLLTHEGNSKNLWNLWECCSQWIAPNRLMTFGLQFSNCGAFQPQNWQKGRGGNSAHYFPVRNSRKDKNISGITDKIHPAGVCFYLYQWISWAESRILAEECLQDEWRDDTHRSDAQNRLNVAYWFNGKNEVWLRN